jgi:putative transposase
VETLNPKVIPALRELNAAYQARTLPTNVVYALENSGDKGVFTELLPRTYYNWLALKEQTGFYAPKKREKDFSVQWWHDMALFLYRRPQKPTLAYVVAKLGEFVASQGVESDAKTAKAALVPAVLLPAALVAPSYGMVERFFKDKVGQIELKKGRNTGMKLRSLKAHKTRTAAGLEPWDEMQSDGLASHFIAPHPMSGEYRTLEVWHAHDVATRIIPPFAVGESENTEVIFKCIENAVRFGGVMVGIQTDHTKVVKDNEKFVGNPMVSIADRAGITIYHPKIAGNSQANGIAENFGVWLNNQAKELCSYQHSTMDSLSFRRMQTLLSKFARAKFRGADDEVNKLRKEIKRMAAGVLFESHQDALDWLEEKRVMWNNRPHSALPKVHDDVTGKKRHQSPQEAFDEFLSYGWQPVTMDEDQLIDLFRPRLPCRVFRGKVKPYSPKVGFYHAELSLWEGKEVVVSWDIMDSSEVRVLDMTGALICMAKYDAPVGYRGQTAREASIEKRDVAKLKRLGKKVEGIRARSGLSVIDSTAVAVSPLKQVVYEGVEFATEPTLRTFADLLADERDENKPVVSEPVDYWGTVQANSEEDKEAL